MTNLAEYLAGTNPSDPNSKLAQAVKEFMGTDVLTLVVKQPAWKSNLVALRERQVGRAWQS